MYNRRIKPRRMIWVERVGQQEEKRKAYRLLVGKPEGKGPLERPTRNWIDNIEMDLAEIEWGDVDWIDLVQDRYRWRALEIDHELWWSIKC
jgi:hypothetical protein